MPILDVVNLMVWNQLRPCLPRGTVLKSVKRPAAAQLNYIVTQATREGYTFDRTPTLGDAASWEGALAFLRAKEYRIAAPGRSAHQTGIAYDLNGPDLEAIEAAVRKAAAQKRISLAHSPHAILRETKNNCVHVEIAGAILYNEQFVHFDRVA